MICNILLISLTYSRNQGYFDRGYYFLIVLYEYTYIIFMFLIRRYQIYSLLNYLYLGRDRLGMASRYTAVIPQTFNFSPVMRMNTQGVKLFRNISIFYHPKLSCLEKFKFHKIYFFSQCFPVQSYMFNYLDAKLKVSLPLHTQVHT